MHLNKQHGLAEVPTELWASAHPLLAETTKLLKDMKTHVGLQSASKGSTGEGHVGGVPKSQIPMLSQQNKTQSGKSKGSNNAPMMSGAIVKKR